MDVRFFETPEAFRAWLERHHSTETEVWVGYYRKGSGRTGMTWAESVDQALCFGWIDGIRKRVDDMSYANRFTPRTKSSTWSAVNIKRAGELIDEGLMRPAGLRAFEARSASRSGVYSYEQRIAGLPAEYEKAVKKNGPAWDFFRAQTASYRKAVGWWVASAKREETRLRRLEQLIEHSAAGRTVPQFTRAKPSA